MTASAVPVVASDRRVRYSQAVKEEIARRYPHCRSTADKLALCRDQGIVDDEGQPDLNRLYNLASRLKATSVASNEDVIVAAREAAMDPARRRLREEPRGLVFGPEADRYITRWWGRQEIEIIGMQTGHTEIAVAFRARQLGLRRPVRHWQLGHVIDWLDIDRPTFDQLGLPVLVCCDRFARPRIELIDAEVLAHFLTKGGRWQRMHAQLKAAGRNMDLFFIHEVVGASLDLRRGAEPEALWVSHGHICLNPLAPLSFGHFYSGEDPRIAAVCELTPEQTSPDQIYHHRWLAESWRLSA